MLETCCYFFFRGCGKPIISRRGGESGTWFPCAEFFALRLIRDVPTRADSPARTTRINLSGFGSETIIRDGRSK